jgi:hypothetical protein
MIKYKNLSGRSGVDSYEIGNDQIKVKFRDGVVYTYNNIKPGRLLVDQMVRYALAGKGLNAFIQRFVKKKYSKKINCC